MPKKVPDYRLQRDHSQFLCDLRSHYNSRREVEASFLVQLEAAFPEMELLPLVRGESSSSSSSSSVVPSSLEEHVALALAGRELKEVSRTKYVEL
jgi:hypothetical protein